MTARATWRVALLWAMALSLVAYLVGLTAAGDPFPILVDGWLGNLTQWLPAAVCWAAAARVRLRRHDIVLAACAVTSFAAGNSYYVVNALAGDGVGFPSPADAGYLLFFPLMLTALAIVARRHARGLVSSMWLDVAVGSLGAAAVLAVVLSPVLSNALDSSRPFAAVVAVAYPLFDLLLVAAVVGLATIEEIRVDRRWGVLVAGLLVFTAADVVYALRLAQDVYAVGTPLDAGWAVGLTLVAFWVDGAARPEDPAALQGRGSVAGTALVVPAVATAASLCVLVTGSRVRLSTLAVALAGVTLLATAARTHIAFRQLLRMADLRRQAATDDLTGLPNRRALYAALRSRLSEPDPTRAALLLLDLDRFKEVNDSLGHHVGDQLLIEVGTRLRDALRPEDLLARLGGDEFAVLLEDADQAHAVAVASKLRAVLTTSFTLEGIALHTGASIGISLFPDHGDDLSTLLRKADMAMYKAKADRAGHRVYALSDDTHGDARLRTLQELRTALDGDQLVLHYQPKVDLPTGAVRGVEALVRWDHPIRGLLYPDAFLDLIEDSGLMRPMTQIILERALDQAAVWQRLRRPLTVAVNLSASSLVDADLPEQVEAMLRARGLPARSLQLEITEEFLMADRDRARSILSRLRENGVQIAVDDFGTGYSSLSYLRDLPIDELKLDRSFVFPMADDARAAALVASTIALAHSLGLRMVAEGVENQVALTELTRHGCDEAQGYFLSRPVPAAELDHWLATRETWVSEEPSPRLHPGSDV